MGLFLEIDRNVNRWDPERVKALVSYYEVVFRMHVDADKMLKCAPNVKDVTTRQVKLAVLPASASPFDSDRLGFYKSRDKKFLKSISSDKDEPVLFRAIAKAVLSQYYWYHSSDENERVKAWDDTISLCKSVTEDEARRFFVYKELPTAVGSFLHDLRAEIESYFKLFQGTTMLRYNEKTSEDEPIASIPGIECDACQKRRSELKVNTLRVCSVCTLTYYCSKECQRRHYSTHKHQCRKEGDFRPGDYAQMRGKDGSWQSPIKVRLLRIIPNTIDWAVTGIDDRSICNAVKESDLRRIRSATWGAFGMKEIENLMDAKKNGDTSVKIDPDLYELYYAPNPCGQFLGEDLEQVRECVEQAEMDPLDYYLKVIKARKQDTNETGRSELNGS